MKNAIILHGTGDRNDQYWFPYLKTKLEQRGCDVWLPQLPNAQYPNLADWLPFVLENGQFNEETILVGHSKGAQLILSILEDLDVQLKQAILVSGYAKILSATASDPKDEHEPNWEKIKDKVKQFVFVNSDNDPWGCDDSQGRIMLNNLGGILVIPKGEGHMGSTTYNQPYKEHPLVFKLLDI
jgi:uncharacterized protein